jgi:hypothetical protein
MKEERIELTGDVVARRREGDFCGKVIAHDAANIGVWYYVNGEYHRVRKSAKNVIHLDGQSNVELYAYRRTNINGEFSRAFGLKDDKNREYDVTVSFVYRIFDLPLFAASKLTGGRKEIDASTLGAEIMTKDILPFINVNGIKGLSGIDVPNEIVAASADVLKDLRSAAVLSRHGIELVNLKMSVR